jgi:hypothetical protein
MKPVVKERCRQERKVQADRQGPRRWRCRRWSGFISSNTADGQYSRKSAPTNRRSALSRQGRAVKRECSAGRRTNAHRQRSQWFRLVKSTGTQSSSMNSVIPSTPTNNRKNCEHPQHDECRNSKKRHCTASVNGRSDHPTCRYKNAEAPTGAEAQTWWFQLIHGARWYRSCTPRESTNAQAIHEMPSNPGLGKKSPARILGAGDDGLRNAALASSPDQ